MLLTPKLNHLPRPFCGNVCKCELRLCREVSKSQYEVTNEESTPESKDSASLPPFPRAHPRALKRGEKVYALLPITPTTRWLLS